ncbi:flavin-containing monooxygenase [Cellulosimicrobium funkei]|uniref:flavin-containing monooxygenase n=1 Tax=Cellulosimicrobium funkei TaxID=264251 RepID=UPI003D75F102
MNGATRHDVLVVGGGQAGLVTAALLARAGVDYVVLDAGERPGASWARRWDSLRLVTPGRYTALPDFPNPWPGAYYPTKDEVAAYLADYARHHDLIVRHGVRVDQLSVDNAGVFVASGTHGATTARRVVVATGAFHTPFVPDLAHGTAEHIVQLHSHDYRGPQATPGRRVLVVGGGNSGAQIALELARDDREVHLACAGRLRSVRQAFAAGPALWWMTRTATLRASGGVLGRRLRMTDPVIGISDADLWALGVRVRERVRQVTGPDAVLADDTTCRPDTIVWATGYRHDDSWIAVPRALNPHGALVHDDHRTRIAGLHVIGRPWQRTRGSALLGFVGDDARRMVGSILNDRPATDHRNPVALEEDHP